MPVHQESGSTRVTCWDVASATDVGSNAGPEHAASATMVIKDISVCFILDFILKILHFVQNDSGNVQNDIIVILSVSEGSIQQLFRKTKEL